MLLRVEHRFAFSYDSYISESFLELRVQPKPTPAQTVTSFTLAVGPPTRVFRYRDWNDNLAHHFTVTKFHDSGCAKSFLNRGNCSIKTPDGL